MKGNVNVNENAEKMIGRNASDDLLVSKNASAPRSERGGIKSAVTKSVAKEMSAIVQLNARSKIGLKPESNHQSLRMTPQNPTTVRKNIVPPIPILHRNEKRPDPLQSSLALAKHLIAGRRLHDGNPSQLKRNIALRRLIILTLRENSRVTLKRLRPEKRATLRRRRFRSVIPVKNLLLQPRNEICLKKKALQLRRSRASLMNVPRVVTSKNVELFDRNRNRQNLRLALNVAPSLKRHHEKATRLTSSRSKRRKMKKRIERREKMTFLTILLPTTKRKRRKRKK